MKTWRKIIAGSLIASMLFGTIFVSGCNKKKKQGEVIPDDAPWYTVEKIDLSGAYYNDGTNYDYIYFEYCDSFEDSYVMRVGGSKTIPADFDWDTDNWRDYEVNDLVVFDKSGNITKSINLSTVSDEENFYFGDITVEGSTATGILTVYDEKTWEEKLFEVTIDLKTGEIGKPVPTTNDTSNQTYNEDEYSEGVEKVGDYKVEKYWISNDNGSTYRLEITDKTGSKLSVNMGELFPNESFWNIDKILLSSETTGIVIASTEGSSGLYTLDLTNGKMEEVKDTDWLKDINTYNIATANGAAYSVSTSGVYKLDFDNGEAVSVLDFNNCSVNKAEINTYSLLDIDDNSVTFFSQIDNYAPYAESKTETSIVVMTKADSNPNAGKTILEVCCLSGIDVATADAIVDYNETNPDYFLIVDESYNLDDNMDYTSDLNQEEWNQMYNQAQAELSNQLAIDLMNGDGPDIIIGGFPYGQLNNETYLTDLTSYMNEFGVSGYFSNVFDGAKVDGKLFQIPTSFYMMGIITDKKNVKSGQTGFTFDEYKTFVDKVCNGNDPITLGQVDYFTACVDSMNDLFIDGGKASYNNEAFNELADYVKDNVNEHFEYEDDEMMWTDSWEAPAASYTSFSGFASYLDSYNSDNGPQNQVILGLPSYDARGPEILTYNSVAISSQAIDVDACWEFVEILLGEKAQISISQTWSFPVKISAFESTANDMIDYYNKSVRGEGNFSMSGRPSAGVELDKSIVNTFESDIISTGHVVISDPSITVIISEEIPAYLSGQKSIDQVTDILENRVNTVMNERG